MAIFRAKQTAKIGSTIQLIRLNLFTEFGRTAIRNKVWNINEVNYCVLIPNQRNITDFYAINVTTASDGRYLRSTILSTDLLGYILLTRWLIIQDIKSIFTKCNLLENQRSHIYISTNIDDSFPILNITISHGRMRTKIEKRI